jgi:hypothetical protein
MMFVWNNTGHHILVPTVLCLQKLDVTILEVRKVTKCDVILIRMVLYGRDPLNVEAFVKSRFSVSDDE